MDVERERLVAHTREAVAKGLASGNMWHAATNAEHARPMLQVSYGCPPELLESALLLVEQRASRSMWHVATNAQHAQPMLQVWRCLSFAMMCCLEHIAEPELRPITLDPRPDKEE